MELQNLEKSKSCYCQVQNDSCGPLASYPRADQVPERGLDKGALYSAVNR